MINFDTNTVKKYLPYLLRNMSTGKDFDFDFDRDFIPGYLRGKDNSQKTRAAVFSPPRLIRRMNIYLAMRPDNFIPHDKKVIEPACGEGAFITMRYDLTTGESISDIRDRDGILDWKLREGIFQHPCMPFLYSGFIFQAMRQIKSVYGFEKHIPSLIIARVNILLSFIEVARYFFKPRKNIQVPFEEDINEVCRIICWNFWHMDIFKQNKELIINWETNKIEFFSDVFFERQRTIKF